MKNWAILALCLFSSFASANQMEEVVVKARQIKIVLKHLSENHRQNPITGNWYYVEEKKKDSKESTDTHRA